LFYRGAAAIMAADLAHTPATGIRVQCCGDAHIKRLTTSFLIASRNNGFSEAEARQTALGCVRSYRQRMIEFAQMRPLDVWYTRLDLATILRSVKDEEAQKRLRHRIHKAEASDVLETDFPKLVTLENGEPTIRDNPPLIYHVREQAGPEF
jgi:uncharacterized protein (DUF2252 family)